MYWKSSMFSGELPGTNYIIHWSDNLYNNSEPISFILNKKHIFNILSVVFWILVILHFAQTH